MNTTYTTETQSIRKPTPAQVAVYEAINSGCEFNQLTGATGFDEKKLFTVITQLVQRGNLSMTVNTLGWGNLPTEEERKEIQRQKAKEYRNRPEVKERLREKARAKREELAKKGRDERNARMEEEINTDPLNPKGRSPEEMAERLAARKARKEQRKAEKKANKKLPPIKLKDITPELVGDLYDWCKEAPKPVQNPAKDTDDLGVLIGIELDETFDAVHAHMEDNKRKFNTRFRESFDAEYNGILRIQNWERNFHEQVAKFRKSPVDAEAKRELIGNKEGFKVFADNLSYEIKNGFFKNYMLASIDGFIFQDLRNLIFHMKQSIDNTINTAFNKMRAPVEPTTPTEEVKEEVVSDVVVFEEPKPEELNVHMLGNKELFDKAEAAIKDAIDKVKETAHRNGGRKFNKNVMAILADVVVPSFKEAFVERINQALGFNRDLNDEPKFLVDHLLEEREIVMDCLDVFNANLNVDNLRMDLIIWILEGMHDLDRGGIYVKNCTSKSLPDRLKHIKEYVDGYVQEAYRLANKAASDAYREKHAERLQKEYDERMRKAQNRRKAVDEEVKKHIPLKPEVIKMMRSLKLTPVEGETYKSAFRRMSMVAHPDRGGSDKKMTAVNLLKEKFKTLI